MSFNFYHFFYIHHLYSIYGFKIKKQCNLFIYFQEKGHKN